MNEPTPQSSTASEATLEAARREKLRKIREMGIDPWGSRFDGHQPIGEIRDREGEITVDAAGGEKGDHPPEQHGPKVRAAGRIVLRRPSGKVHWLQIRDWSGTIQVMLGKSQVGDENFALAQCLDLGDIIGVDGELKRTMKGELTIFAEELKLLSKSIATPPEKHKGLADPELRQRRRYLDLIHTDGVLETFLRRSKIVQSIRNTLAGRGFVEVEGPTLQTIAGGAAARPFITHHNALDIDLYLRIALELHLKRLLVGGIERVYEMGRVYRNEGIDARHNPEFTMIEIYQAYGNYETMMELTEAMIVDAIRAMDGAGGEGRGTREQSAVGSRQSPGEMGEAMGDTGEKGASPPSAFRLPPSANPQSPIPNPSLTALTLALSQRERGLRKTTRSFCPGARRRSTSRHPSRKTYDELFAEHTGLRPDDVPGIAKMAESLGFNAAGKHADVVKSFVFEEKVEKALVRPIVRDRLSGEPLPFDEAKGRQSGDCRAVRVVRSRHGIGQRLHGAERPRPSGRAFHQAA